MNHLTCYKEIGKYTLNDHPEPKEIIDIIKSFGIDTPKLLNSGMEAKVYALDDKKVIKLYHSSTSLMDLQTLASFYRQLDRSPLSYALPNIKHIETHGRYTVAIEERLSGQPLTNLISRSHPKELNGIFENYLAAVHELSQIRMPDHATRYKLFDPHRISNVAAGDWHHFILRYLDRKLEEVNSYLMRDVKEFDRKIKRIRSIFSAPYKDPYRLIHGDFFPGNLHVDQVGRPTALLDFGVFTMYGDPLFDLATSWVFFDMYDEMQANIRQRLLAIILERFGEDVRKKLARYVLLYSLLSANTYSSTCNDGHYQWCVANLNDTIFWNYID